jgi:renalase
MAADARVCLIIGGGITGLIAAVTLQRQGLQPLVLDKGYGSGGRLASRRVQASSGSEGLFDYGAQQFTVGTPTFQAWVDDWLRQGIVKVWSTGFADTPGGVRPSDRPHYCGTDNQRAIAQHLAQTLAIHQRQNVIRLDWQDGQWVAHTETGQRFVGDLALLTPPLPQTLGLLASSGIAVPAPLRLRLEAVTYTRCIAVLALLTQESIIPEPGGLYLDCEPLQWIASNFKKGISSGYGVTLHGGPEFSQQYWQAENDAIAEHLIAAAQPWLNGLAIAHHVHRWKYSQPQQRFSEPFAWLDHPGPLVLAGDGFGPAAAASALEGAALSGLAAAAAIVEL